MSQQTSSTTTTTAAAADPNDCVGTTSTSWGIVDKPNHPNVHSVLWGAGRQTSRNLGRKLRAGDIVNVQFDENSGKVVFDVNFGELNASQDVALDLGMHRGESQVLTHSVTVLTHSLTHALTYFSPSLTG